MAGLIDDDTGLAFGTGLQFQTPIGGAGLVISSGGVTPEVELLWGADNALLWGGSYLVWGSTAGGPGTGSATGPYWFLPFWRES